MNDTTCKIFPPLNFDESQIGLKSHFLDSGAFAFWTISEEYAKQHKTDRFRFFNTQEFRKYLDEYAAFIKRGAIAIDYYSNVDVIPHPELSWRNLKYLEDKHGLSPVPVIHYPTPLKWVERHLKAGYKYIALGGLVGSHGQAECRTWIDSVFDLICSTPNNTPAVWVHGFGVTSYELLFRYPWYSVDSSYWAKQGAFGRILVPHTRRGKFTFEEQPYSVAISNDAKERNLKGQHYWTMPMAERNIVHEWLNYLKVNLGHYALDGTLAMRGVTNNYSYRKYVNLRFFEELLKCVKPYPWPYKSNKRRAQFKLDIK